MITHASTMESCCTCAKLLSRVPRYDASSEKPLPSDRRLECCGRVICGSCIHNNARFSSYCPYCQISESSSVLPPGLRAPPPSYASSVASFSNKPQKLPPPPPPPPYTPFPADDPRLGLPLPPPPPPPSQASSDSKSETPTPTTPSTTSTTSSPTQPPTPQTTPEKAQQPPQEGVLHFLRQPHDTIPSLSLRYGVPAPALRRANRLHSDHLLAARRTILIPGTSPDSATSLSPRPVEGEEGERRARALRRWMVRCKVADYDVALLYLGQAAYDCEAAVGAYLADEAWERAHPLEGGEGKKKGVAVGGWLGR